MLAFGHIVFEFLYTENGGGCISQQHTVGDEGMEE